MVICWWTLFGVIVWCFHFICTGKNSMSHSHCICCNRGFRLTNHWSINLWNPQFWTESSWNEKEFHPSAVAGFCKSTEIQKARIFMEINLKVKTALKRGVYTNTTSMILVIVILMGRVTNLWEYARIFDRTYTSKAFLPSRVPSFKSSRQIHLHTTAKNSWSSTLLILNRGETAGNAETQGTKFSPRTSPSYNKSSKPRLWTTETQSTEIW